jgi:hypothetical protein
MPENPSAPFPSSTPSDARPSEQPTPHDNTESSTSFNIGEEFGTAKKSLPPTGIVFICLVILVVVVAIFAFVQRPQSSATGSIGEVSAAEIPNQNSTMIAINVSFKNGGDRTFYIHNIKADLTTDSGNFSDEAASAVDFDRYFQAFPNLKEHALAPLKPEDKIAPSADAQGTIIVSFPVSLAAFNSRKSLKVSVWAYDQAVPLVMVK